MIQLTNSVAQTIQPGQTVTFENPPSLKTGCGECFNPQLPNSVRLNAPGGVYDIEFSGNATTDPAATGQLAFSIGTTPITDTAMNFTPATAGDLVNINTGTLFRNNCGDVNRISILNTGTVAVTLAPNFNFRITRKS